MKRLIAVLLLILLCCPAALASESPYAIMETFLNYTDLSWSVDEEYDDDTVSLYARANFGGHPYEFGVNGILEGGGARACQIWFSGWFQDMKMLDEGLFSDGLHAYNDCWNTAEQFIPDDMDADEIFSSYNIYYCVDEGLYGVNYSSSWEVVDNGGGALSARHSGPYLVSAEHLDDGRIWFIVMFP